MLKGPILTFFMHATVSGRSGMVAGTHGVISDLAAKCFFGLIAPKAPYVKIKKAVGCKAGGAMAYQYLSRKLL